MKQLILDLIKEQDKLNTIINPAWKKERSIQDFKRALIVESGELLEHSAFKWWKAQKVDTPQAKMEIIDLWFFYLSLVIISPTTLPHHGTDEEKLEYFASMVEEHSGLSNSESLEWCTASVHNLTVKFVNEVSNSNTKLLHGMYTLSALTIAAGISIDELYKVYIGKLILNIFRQENGYSTGTYVKEWNGLEDNQVLAEIMEDIHDPKLIKEALKDGYDKRYTR
jgi:hypothetical protein